MGDPTVLTTLYGRVGSLIKSLSRHAVEVQEVMRLERKPRLLADTNIVSAYMNALFFA